jgi:hypothetical protein
VSARLASTPDVVPTRPRVALKAWRRRGDPKIRDALSGAAMWEAAGDLERAAAIVAAAVSCQDPLCHHEADGCLWWRGWRERRARERRQGRQAEAERWERLAAENVAKRRVARGEPAA